MTVGLTETLVMSAFTETQYGQYDLLKTTTFSEAIFSLTVSMALANVRTAPRARSGATGADNDRVSARRAARAGAEPMERCMASERVA
jgi:hypothetical protein